MMACPHGTHPYFAILRISLIPAHFWLLCCSHNGFSMIVEWALTIDIVWRSWSPLISQGRYSSLDVVVSSSVSVHGILRRCAFFALLWIVVHYSAQRADWVRFTASLYLYHVCLVYEQPPVHWH